MLAFQNKLMKCTIVKLPNKVLFQNKLIKMGLKVSAYDPMYDTLNHIVEDMETVRPTIRTQGHSTVSQAAFTPSFSA